MKNLPKNVEYERAFLGSIMIDNEAVVIGFEKITEADAFYKEAHQKIFEACKFLFESDKTIDILSVTNELDKAGSLELVGGSFYLTGLCEIPSSANIETYCEVLQKMQLRRRLIQLSLIHI